AFADGKSLVQRGVDGGLAWASNRAVRGVSVKAIVRRGKRTGIEPLGHFANFRGCVRLVGTLIQAGVAGVVPWADRETALEQYHAREAPIAQSHLLHLITGSE